MSSSAADQCASHTRALQLKREALLATDPHEEVHDRGAERLDVVSFVHIANALSILKRGGAFRTFPNTLKCCRLAGGHLFRNRLDRRIVPKVAMCVASELRAEDKMLLRLAKAISITMDGRGRQLIIRARMTLKEIPRGFCQVAAAAEPRAAEVSTTEATHRLRPLVAHGKFLHMVDRMVAMKRLSSDGFHDDAMGIAEAVRTAQRELCQGDDALWKNVRHKVRILCPDGAADEQLASRLLCATFPNLHWVLRCSAHAVQGCMKKAWAVDEDVVRITKSVSAVAAFIRSSPRFADRQWERASRELRGIAAISNFSFAPQRFSSKEKPLVRFVLFARPLMEVLAEEAERTSTPARAKWAWQILSELNGATWITIGMLADLASDCTDFLRKWDRGAPDVIAFSSRLVAFQAFLQAEYIEQDMWARERTYTARVARMLRTTRVLHCGSKALAVARPSADCIRDSIHKVARVASALRQTLRSEFPPSCIQRSFCCFAAQHGLAPTDRQEDQLRNVVRQMQWPIDRENRCVEQFKHRFAAVHSGMVHEKLPASEAWAREVMRHEADKELGHLIQLVWSALISETECERSFARDRAQLGIQRGRLSQQVRANCLKVMLDCPPLDTLVREGGQKEKMETQCNFFSRVQEIYAARVGTRRLTNVRARRDTGKRVSGRERKRGGLETTTSVQKKRRLEVRSAAEPRGAPGQNVFGGARVPKEELELRGPGMQLLLGKAKAQYDQKQKQVMDLYSRVAGARKVSQPSVKQKAAARRRRAGALVRATKERWGRKWGSGEDMMEQLRGPPLIFCEVDGLLPQALRDSVFAHGHKVSRYVFDGALADFVRSPRDIDRRIILVNTLNVKDTPVAHFAALLTGARLQTELFGPRLSFAVIAHTLACTASFKRACPRCYSILRAASQRPGSEVVLVSIATLKREAETHRGKGLLRLTVLMMSTADDEIRGWGGPAKKVLRTLETFLAAFSVQRAAL